jgi:hypothetical protein
MGLNSRKNKDKSEWPVTCFVRMPGLYETGPRYHRSRQPRVRRQGRRRIASQLHIRRLPRNPSASIEGVAQEAPITAPVSHQKRSQRDATNTIGRVKSQ